MIEFISHVHPAAVPHFMCLRHSLEMHEPEHRHSIIAWDGAFHMVVGLSGMLTVYSAADMEHDCRSMGIDWGSLRGTRSERDLAWTAQACMPYWLMQRCPDLKGPFVYLDNDTYFFQPLSPILNRLPETAHVGVCKHWFPPGKENVSAGVFNNGTIWWRNSDISREHFKRWALETIERWNPSHPRAVPHEQKLLDEWPEQLGDALAVLPRTVDAGPWRLVRVIESPEGPVIGTDLLQSWHFHETRAGTGRNPVTLKGQQWNCCNYEIDEFTRKSVYDPYIALLETFL